MTGLFGGIFNPPHLGHLELARAALERFRLERLLVLVVARPAHKPVDVDVETRLRLAEAAFGDLPKSEVRQEPHSFTVDSLREGRFSEAVFLVGADEYADFATWRDPEGVLSRAHLGVATRAGYPQPEIVAEHEGRVTFFEIESPPISSSDVRERVRRGEPIDHLVPRAVARLIAELGLYRG